MVAFLSEYNRPERQQKNLPNKYKVQQNENYIALSVLNKSYVTKFEQNKVARAVLIAVKGTKSNEKKKSMHQWFCMHCNNISTIGHATHH